MALTILASRAGASQGLGLLRNGNATAFEAVPIWHAGSIPAYSTIMPWLPCHLLIHGLVAQLGRARKHSYHIDPRDTRRHGCAVWDYDPEITGSNPVWPILSSLSSSVHSPHSPSHTMAVSSSLANLVALNLILATRVGTRCYLGKDVGLINRSCVGSTPTTATFLPFILLEMSLEIIPRR